MELMEMQTNELKKAAEFGTPLYVFHEEELQETTRRFQNTLGKVAGLCYAMKANPFLVKVMEPIVDRIEVCSMGEFAICEEQGVAPEKILVSGVLKKAEKLNAVLDKYGNSCMYTAESLQQFELLKNWSAEHRQEISVFPRLTSGNQFGMDQKTIGFNADIRDKRDYNIGDVLKHALPQDFVKFGLIPEFIGRVPVTVSLDMLDRDALIRILQEPKNALTKQYQKLFELDGVALNFDKEALEAIADKALERKTGARGLRAIMEAVTLDLMYHIPSDESITQCQITKEMVDEQLAIEERELEKIEEKQVG